MSRLTLTETDREEILREVDRRRQKYLREKFFEEKAWSRIADLKPDLFYQLKDQLSSKFYESITDTGVALIKMLAKEEKEPENRQPLSLDEIFRTRTIDDQRLIISMEQPGVAKANKLTTIEKILRFASEYKDKGLEFTMSLRFMDYYMELLQTDDPIEDEEREFVAAYLRRYNELAEKHESLDEIKDEIHERITKQKNPDFEELNRLFKECGSLGEVIECSKIDIPKFTIIRKLGEGGGSKVYLAEYELWKDWKRQYALKIYVRPDEEVGYGSPTNRKTRKEVIGNMVMHAMDIDSHPNVVRYYHSAEYDHPDHGNTFYTTEEYVDGGNLKEMLPQIPKSKALELLEQAVEGVKHIHKKGRILRDIKLDNILVSADLTRAKIGDLEHVTFADQGETAPLTHGSERYAAPEAMRGEPLTYASDAYSLACCVYAILTQDVKEDDKLRVFEDINQLPREQYEEALEKMLGKNELRFWFCWEPEKRQKAREIGLLAGAWAEKLDEEYKQTP